MCVLSGKKRLEGLRYKGKKLDLLNKTFTNSKDLQIANSIYNIKFNKQVMFCCLFLQAVHTQSF